MGIDTLTRILQASIAPCVLISGLGLLLLSIANRLGRPIDRIRLLCSELKTSSLEESANLKEQISILYKRCQLLQTSVALIVISVFFVSVIILLLFSTHIFYLHLENLIELLFMASLICLISSLVFFLLDIRAALHSVTIEIKKYI